MLATPIAYTQKVPLANSQGVADTANCNSNIYNNSGISNETAMTLAKSSKQFLSDVSAETFYLNGIAASWRTYPDCQAKLVSYDANFIFTNSTGFKQDVIVSINASAPQGPLAVVGVLEMPAMTFGSSSLNGIWAGYQFCDGVGSGGAYCQSPPVNTMLGAVGTFIEPKIVQPPSGPSCGGNVACALAIWSGIDTYAPGGGAILQTGTMTHVEDCIPGTNLCTTLSYLWWEDYESASSSATFCADGSLQSNDQVSENVYLSGVAFSVYSQDITTGQTCTSSPNPYFWGHTAYYSDFMLERPVLNGGRTDLPQFINFYFQGKAEEQGAYWFPITTYYNDGWYYTEIMHNLYYTNICAGIWSLPNCYASVSAGSTGYGEFYNNWITSLDT